MFLSLNVRLLRLKYDGISMMSCVTTDTGSLVFDGDRLRLEVLIKGLLPQILAESGHLEAAKRCRHVRLVVRIDEHGSGLDFLRKSERPTDILGEDSRGQTEFGVVRPRDHLIDILGAEFGNHHHWTKGLLPSNVHVIPDVREYCRFEVPAGTIQPFAAVNQFGTLLDPLLHEL